MEVKIVLNLDELRKRLCKDCQQTMDAYLKELAVAKLIEESKEGKK